MEKEKRYMEIYSDNRIQTIECPADVSDLIVTEMLNQVNFARGKTLTIIEAVIANENQQKSVKDLIYNVFHDLQESIYKQLYKKDSDFDTDIVLKIETKNK